MSVPIPTVLQHKLFPHRKRRLEIDITEQKNKIYIILDLGKTFLQTKTPREKHD